MLVKWHVAREFARAIQLDEIASRTQTGSPIKIGKTTFDLSLREEDDNIGSALPCLT